MLHVLRIRPALFALPSYRASDLGRDVVAGLVVAAVALPLAVAFGIASGADPRAGLVTAAVAGAVAAFFGGSRFQVTGPTGAFVVVLAGVVAQHGMSGLWTATFLAGIMLLLGGLFGLGRFIRFIPYPITTGFTAGIAVVIFVGQLPEMLGLTVAAGPGAIEKVEGIAHVLRDWSPWALGVTVATILIIQSFKRWAPRVPGPVVALVLGSAAVAMLDIPVATVGDRFTIPRGLPAFVAPDLSLDTIRAVFPSAITIALLGAIESLLSAVVADGMTGARHDPDQELFGQGLANLASPLFGGLAATGAIARTATNVQNGARSPVASLVHAGAVLGILVSLAPLASQVPMPVLGGILAVVAWNMSERHNVRRLLRLPRAEVGVLVTTFLLTVVVDLTVAVTVGLLLAVVVFMRRMRGITRVDLVDPRSDDARRGHAFAPEDIPHGARVYSIDGPFFFGAADMFQETLASVTDLPRVLVLRMREVPYMDATGLVALESAIDGLHKRGVRVMLSGIQSQPLDYLQRSGLLGKLGDEAVHRTTPEALAAARTMLDRGDAPT